MTPEQIIAKHLGVETASLNNDAVIPAGKAATILREITAAAGPEANLDLGGEEFEKDISVRDMLFGIILRKLEVGGVL